MHPAAPEDMDARQKSLDWLETYGKKFSGRSVREILGACWTPVGHSGSEPNTDGSVTHGLHNWVGVYPSEKIMPELRERWRKLLNDYDWSSNTCIDAGDPDSDTLIKNVQALVNGWMTTDGCQVHSAHLFHRFIRESLATRSSPGMDYVRTLMRYYLHTQQRAAERSKAPTAASASLATAMPKKAMATASAVPRDTTRNADAHVSGDADAPSDSAISGILFGQSLLNPKAYRRKVDRTQEVVNLLNRALAVFPSKLVNEWKTRDELKDLLSMMLGLGVTSSPVAGKVQNYFAASAIVHKPSFRKHVQDLFGEWRAAIINKKDADVKILIKSDPDEAEEIFECWQQISEIYIDVMLPTGHSFRTEPSSAPSSPPAQSLEAPAVGNLPAVAGGSSGGSASNRSSHQLSVGDKSTSLTQYLPTRLGNLINERLEKLAKVACDLDWENLQKVQKGEKGEKGKKGKKGHGALYAKGLLEAWECKSWDRLSELAKSYREKFNSPDLSQEDRARLSYVALWWSGNSMCVEPLLVEAMGCGREQFIAFHPFPSQDGTNGGKLMVTDVDIDPCQPRCHLLYPVHHLLAELKFGIGRDLFFETGEISRLNVLAAATTIISAGSGG
ncbi:hypothetical protein HKX48_000238 [Thoreauomyces humboldtii]|nr:hypothetical protein HKX48_000238 [Thoreauomyces humboldtii]